MTSSLAKFTDVLDDVIEDSQPLSLASNGYDSESSVVMNNPGSEVCLPNTSKPTKGTGQYGEYRSVEEIDPRYRGVFTYPFFNMVQSKVIEDALYSDKSMVICAPTGSGKTVIFEMAIVQLLMELEADKNIKDYKIIYMAPVKALCTERLTEWYSKFTRLGLTCIAVTGDTDVDFSQLKPFRIIITTPEKWDMLTRRWRDHKGLVDMIKLFLIDEVHILNDVNRGPVLEAVVSRMKTIQCAAQSAHRIEQLQSEYQGTEVTNTAPPKMRFVAVSATVSNPDDVASWLGTPERPAVFYKFGDECRPVKLKRVVEGYPCPDGMSIFKFDIVLNYKISPIIQKYYNGKPTLIFCNTRKSVLLTAEMLSKELSINFDPQQKAKLTALASSIKNKKFQTLLLNGVGCHHAGMLYEERTTIEHAFRNRDLPILITTTTLAMGVNLPAHLVIIKNTQQYISGAYQEYSISTVLQMVGRAGRPQYDTEATAVIMTTLKDKSRYQALVGGIEPLQSYLHKRLAENVNSEAALGTIDDVAQCVQWLRSTFLYVRAGRDPKRYLGLPPAASQQLISKKIEELCVKAMNSLASSGMITMDETCSIQSTEAGRLMSIYYLDLGTMKNIMKIEGSETLEQLLWIVCECHELADMHLRMDERRLLNSLNRNNAATTIRFPMKGKITTRQMKLNCIIQAVLGCLPIADPSLNQEAMKIMRIVNRICKCLVAYVTHPELTTVQTKYYSAILNSLILAKCVSAQLWENSPYVSKQLKGIGPALSNLLATAGKVNFMLLEESHPRDLERILNKGPPMGNLLHKLFTLLPKYQLTMTPIDENIVSVKLLLLNQAHLSENLDELTAGDAHKCYIVIGDSENNLHHLSSFKDKDLINFYDGSITYQMTRKHNFEHKIFAHCISASFVGIDVSSEYVFKSLEPYPVDADICANNEFNTTKKVCKRQTTITETFKECKRKNKNDISQSNEKKKRHTAFMEKFHNLKDSCNITSKQLKDEMHKNTEMSHDILDTDMTLDQSNVYVGNKKQSFEISALDTASDLILLDNDVGILKDNDNSSQVTDDIESILEEIENEISKTSNLTKESKKDENTLITKTTNSNNLKHSYINPYADPHPGTRITKIKNNFNKKTKYNFIDLLERNIDLDSDNEDSPTIENNTGFSHAVKNKIENYLKNTYSDTKPVDRVLEELIHKEEETELPNICFTEITKQRKGECTINENNAKDTTVTTEINIPVNTKVQNDTNDLSQNINTENTRDITLHNSLNKTPDTKLDIETKENQIHRSRNNITATNNSLVPLKKTLSLSEVSDSLEFYENNNSSISVNEQIGQIIHPNSENAVISNSSINTKIQNKDLLHPESIYNLHVSNKVTKDVAYDTIIKDIVIPSTESQISFPYTSKMNLPSTSSSPVTLDKNNQTIKKYSYSITNTDYSTKNFPDHYIRVKRKLQVDVVAEIVSKKEKSDESTNKKATGEEYKTNANLQNNKNVINYIDIAKSTSNDLKQTTRTVKNELHEDISNKIRDKVVVEDEETSKNYKDNTIKEHNISEFRMKSEPINRSQSSIKIPDSGKTAFKKITKPKRPFKINQLHNIHVSLPESLIEKSNTSSHSIRECTKMDEQLIKHTPEKLKYQNVPDNINFAALELKITEIGPQECEPRIDLGPTNDIQMDQSMFDPKALLQTLSLKTDNEAIILPPPEFSDNVDSGTSQVIGSLYTDMDSPNYFDNAKVPNSLCMDLQNIDHNSKEIDTWTLSRNDWKLAKNTTKTCLDDQLNTECVRSFTITQSSRWSRINNSIPISTRHKLAQFRHIQKEKIKK